VYGLAVDLQNPQVVYAATSNHGLLKTADGGQSWGTVQGGLPQAGAFTVAISPGDANLILAGFERKALYLSVDGGQTWNPSARGMNPEAQITSVLFDPAGRGEVIYAADLFGGVYRSSDRGGTWSAINNGLLMRSVNALAISSDGLHLYAGTEGGGTYRLDLNNEAPASASVPTPVPVPTTVAPLPAATPTPASPFGNLPCGGALLLPVLILGITWLLRYK
jgi:photosystem II stability/assembly factor-like uncharacterized protein